MPKVLFQMLFCLLLEGKYNIDIMLQSIEYTIIKRPLHC